MNHGESAIPIRGVGLDRGSRGTRSSAYPVGIAQLFRSLFRTLVSSYWVLPRLESIECEAMASLNSAPCVRYYDQH